MIAVLLRYLAVAAIGYLLGCSNMALYLGRARGVDLRAVGSGNLGASNAMIALGWGAGVLVGLHDIGKGVLSVLLCRWLFPELAFVGVVAGVACVLGHIYPFYMGFRGGKGFAAYLGMALGLSWKFALILMAAVVVLTLVTDFIAVGTVATVLSYPVFMGLTVSWWAALILCAATFAILYKHRENYVRIRNGTEIGLRRARHK